MKTFINRHPVSAVIISCVVLVGACFFLFRDSLTQMTERIKSRDEQPTYKYIRIPSSKDERSYKRLMVAYPKGKNRLIFRLPPTEDPIINVGIVRNFKSGTDTAEARFRAYEKRWFFNKTYVDATRQFAAGEQANWLIEVDGNGSNEMICEIEPKIEGRTSNSEAQENFEFTAPVVCYKRRPSEFNIILISYDTLRADHLGCYGYARDTSPNIDAFSKESVLFTQAISPSPWTCPSHYSIFTSLNPRTVESWERPKKYTISNRFKSIESRETLANILRENGYCTVAFTNGGHMSSSFGFGHGFDFYWETLGAKPVENGEKDTAQIFGEAYRWLEGNSGIRFFMFLHTYECHEPFMGDYFTSPDTDEKSIQHNIDLYDSGIRAADYHFGKLIEKLQSMNILENTIIVFLSDHGVELGDHYLESDIIEYQSEDDLSDSPVVGHGHSLYEELLHIPLILYFPGFEPSKRIFRNQVRLIDVFPTVLDFLGIEYAGPMQGNSLLQLIRTGKREEDPPAVGEWVGIGPQRASLRKDGYKYIWIENPDQFSLCTFKNLQQNELFDLTNDPEEKVNIFEQHKELAGDYRKTLEEQLAAEDSIRKIFLREKKGTEPEQNEIDDNLANQLKALGYLK